jgi:L-threonylcarbamoyladenylate synthase
MPASWREAFWPGPLTIVVKRAADCPVSELVSAGLSSIAIRVPGHDGARKLLEAAGLNPLPRRRQTSQARYRQPGRNTYGQGLKGVSGACSTWAPCEVGLESTIVSCLDEEPVPGLDA